MANHLISRPILEPFGVSSLFNASDSTISSPAAWISDLKLNLQSKLFCGGQIVSWYKKITGDAVHDLHERYIKR